MSIRDIQSFPFDGYGARIRHIHTNQTLHQRRFARAAFTHQRMHHSLAGTELNIAQSTDTWELLGNTFHRKTAASIPVNANPKAVLVAGGRHRLLAGIDPALTGVAGKDRSEASMFQAWPMKIRNEAHRFSPRGQRFLAAVQWPAIFGGADRQPAPAGALLITERELVVISEEKSASAESSSAEELKEKFGGTITFVPRVGLTDFHVSHQESFDVLALELHAAHGGQKLEIIFPSDEEKAIRKAMEQMLLSQGTANQIIRKN